MLALGPQMAGSCWRELASGTISLEALMVPKVFVSLGNISISLSFESRDTHTLGDHLSDDLLFKCPQQPWLS